MGGSADDEIPLLVMLFYLFHGAEPVSFTATGSGLTFAISVKDNVRWGVWLGRHIC